MKKTAITIGIIFLIMLGLADLLTTFYGFSLGLIEADGIFIPFGFSAVGIICLLVSNYLVNKKIIHAYTDKIVFCWFSVLSFLPIINNFGVVI